MTQEFLAATDVETTGLEPSQDRTAAQVDFMFEKYANIQAYISRTIFEDFLQQDHDDLDLFVARYDTEQLADTTVRYIHKLLEDS